MKQLRILIAGLGGIGQRHARNLRTLLGDDLELIAYRAKRATPLLTEKMQAMHNKDVEVALGIEVESDLTQALARQPDAVIVANPTSFHLPVAQAAAEAGCHLFIEKPIAQSYDGVPAFLNLVAEKELITVVGYQWRFHPLLELVRDSLTRNVIGRVISVLARFGEYLPGWHPYEDYRQSYASRRQLGGGVLLTQIHDFDYLGWLFGWPSRVYCVGGQLSSLEIDVEDTASTLMECEVAGHKVPVHLHQDYVQRPPIRVFDVIGEKGKLSADLLQSSYSVANEGGELVETHRFDSFERNELFLAEIKHFLGCLRGNEISRISAAEGAKSLRVALAARKSLATGKPVKL